MTLMQEKALMNLYNELDKVEQTADQDVSRILYEGMALGILRAMEVLRELDKQKEKAAEK